MVLISGHVGDKASGLAECMHVCLSYHSFNIEERMDRYPVINSNYNFTYLF